MFRSCGAIAPDDRRTHRDRADLDARHAGRHRRGRRRPADALAERPPVRDQLRLPVMTRIVSGQRQLQHVGGAGGGARGARASRCALTRGLRSNVERRSSPRLRQAEPEQRIDQRERLDRLLRVEIVALGLVGEVEAGPDDRGAADAAGVRARAGARAPPAPRRWRTRRSAACPTTVRDRGTASRTQSCAAAASRTVVAASRRAGSDCVLGDHALARVDEERLGLVPACRPSLG